MAQAASAAANSLITDGFMRGKDVDHYVEQAKQTTISN
jgi:hypothetical protein